MIARSPALCRDARGEEATIIENDGRTLRAHVRGVEFTGALFDDVESSRAHDDRVRAGDRSLSRVRAENARRWLPGMIFAIHDLFRRREPS
jgi:hypothetical protein